MLQMAELEEWSSQLFWNKVTTFEAPISLLDAIGFDIFFARFVLVLVQSFLALL